MSEMLEKARKYEFTQGQQIKAEDRPAFHITPYVGWMNDPTLPQFLRSGSSLPSFALRIS